jgi:hypothetical protein
MTHRQLKKWFLKGLESTHFDKKIASIKHSRIPFSSVAIFQTGFILLGRKFRFTRPQFTGKIAPYLIMQLAIWELAFIGFHFSLLMKKYFNWK